MKTLFTKSKGSKYEYADECERNILRGLTKKWFKSILIVHSMESALKL